VTGVLDQPRDITIDGRCERFRDYEYLVERIELEIEVIQRAEVELETNPDEAYAIWHHIANQSAYLAGLLAAQEQWLADYDALMTQEIESLRAAIRNLPSSSYNGDEEGST
jgi:hypothetical protein